MAKTRKSGKPDKPRQGASSTRSAAGKSSRPDAVVKPLPFSESEDFIRVRGARTHNLRAIDLDVPRGKLVVFTGVSGSGKSSLAFDTIFAEGQRRYIECLSPFARQFLDQLPRPDVNAIDGLPPTISVSQSGLDRSRNPRSIVATLTDIHDYLRLLYARAGEVLCHRCGARLGSQSAEQIARDVLSLPEGERVLLLASLVRGRKGEHREVLQSIRREGFLRARMDGALVLVDPFPEIDPAKVHDIEMVVDRQVVRPGIESRLAESIATAIRHGGGAMIVARQSGDHWIDTAYNTRLACLACGHTYRDIEPRSFSFNSPYGACPHCQGMGIIQEFSLAKCVPDPRLTLLEGAFAPLRAKSGGLAIRFRDELEAWAGSEDWLIRPFGDLPEDLRSQLWLGTQAFRGVRQRLTDAYSSADDALRNSLDLYIDQAQCHECRGSRLAVEGRSVHVGGLAIHQCLALSIDDAYSHVTNLQCPSDRVEISRPLVAEVVSRLQFLRQVGVGYISLDRPVWTLSGGEAQRIRLASCLGSGLNGACYVLDEPTIGLHPRDTARLMLVLDHLRDRNNSVLVVEHDALVMRRADWIVDLGPGAGRNGGTIVQQGPIDRFVLGEGLTADYLSGRSRIEVPNHKRISSAASVREGEAPCLVLEGVTHRNLKDVTLRLPLGRLIAISGVSGSGKSSLVMDVLVPAVRRAIGLIADEPGAFRDIRGVGPLHNVVEVDQSPIGRTPRSCPASYAGVLGPIRAVFAKSREAKARGYGALRFSFNAKEGQCPECQGLGARKIELKFMPDVFAPCTSCRGKRFNRATRAVKFRGKSIADVLEMTIEEAAEFFTNHPRVVGVLSTLVNVGLGYIQLGQWGTTLSGGEAQRLKLAAELSRANPNPTLYVLDEPTTGLHFHDVSQLLSVLMQLVDQGHTVVVIEHNLDLIAAADWMIDLGPEGGPAGGQIVAEGPPSQMARTNQGVTAQALREYGLPSAQV